MGTMDSTNNKKNVKPSDIIGFLSFIFVFIIIFKIYQQFNISMQCLGYSSKEKDKERRNDFHQKKIRFYISAIFYSVLSLSSLGLGSSLIYKEIAPSIKEEFSRKYRINPGLEYRTSSILRRTNHIKIGFGASFLLIHLSIFAFLKFNKSARNTSRLRKILKEHYSSFKDEQIAFVGFAGPVIDITGHSAQEYCSQESLWTSINMKVSKDHIHVHPEKRSLVLFKPTFELAKEYIWDV